MDDVEIIVSIFSSLPLVCFLFLWYYITFKNWPRSRSRKIKLIYFILPFIMIIMILSILITLASYDVVSSPLYISFYLLLGLSWISISALFIGILFDISWRYDGLNLNNKAAALSFVCAVLGLTIVYSAANIGDGPGWWCVFFAYLLGGGAWIFLNMIFLRLTKASERITVERDFSCAIRISGFFIASAIILGRASAGDWTSAYMTIKEFQAGWPVFFFFIFCIIIELFLKRNTLQEEEKQYGISVTFSLMYIISAILVILYVIPLY